MARVLQTCVEMGEQEPAEAQHAETKQTVRSALEDALALIDSPEQAEAVLARIEQRAGTRTEEDKAEAATEWKDATGKRVEQAAHADAPPTQRAAATLSAAAAEAVAPTPTAPDVVKGAREAVGTSDQSSHAEESARVRRGRKHLKEAALRRMAPLQALDARIFLAVNQMGHPRWLDRVADWVAITANGGWLWGIGVAAAGIAGAPRPGRLLVGLVPTVAVTALVVEYPIKTIFRRRRPFIDVVRALVVGKEPGSWSFPSGHTATAFAAAVLVHGAWPRSTPLAYALAAATGLSRIYVGVHYPGDVLSGAACGFVIGWLFRLLLGRKPTDRAAHHIS